MRQWRKQGEEKQKERREARRAQRFKSMVGRKEWTHREDTAGQPALLQARQRWQDSGDQGRAARGGKTECAGRWG